MHWETRTPAFGFNRFSSVFSEDMIKSHFQACAFEMTFYYIHPFVYAAPEPGCI